MISLSTARLLFIWASSGLLALSGSLKAAENRHVVVVVWDGMRPDFINAKNTPTLWALAQEGVTFQNHHSVFVSSTEVNGTALGTGSHPGTSGVMANKEYRPGINASKSVALEDLEVIRKGDAISHDRYLQVATVAEILRAQKPALNTTIAGTKPVVLLLDRAERADDSTSRILFEGETLPAAALPAITAALGAFPPVGKTKIERDSWTTRALLEKLWAEGVPSYSLLWLAEPDFAQHATSPGSETSLAAIRNSDDQLALVLKILEEKKALPNTDVFVVSDHGFSTIERNADLVSDLAPNGFVATRAYAKAPANGDVLVVANGGSANLYVAGHDQAVLRRLVEFLQTRDYTGVLFTRDALPGTFPLALARIDTPEAPDLVISFQWSDGANIHGAPGLQISEIGGERGPGEGNHASLSRFDLHNILLAAGPDFKKGVTDPLPSGNTDLAPTILWLLGVKPPKPMDGRVLSEALTVPGPKLESFDTVRHTASAVLGAVTWHQYLTISSVNGVPYFDEGNGGPHRVR